MRVPQQALDSHIRRVAQDYLESLMETEMAPRGSEKAQLLRDVCPIYRLDVSGVAYWEFEVDVPGSSGAILMTPDMARTQPSTDVRERLQTLALPSAGRVGDINGFIMVSTGEHDFPVPHWSLQRPPVSRQLEEAAIRSGNRVARIFKLDALAYVAEDEAGNEVARSGQTPVPVDGLPSSGTSGETSSMIARPERSGKDDDADRLPHRVTRTGPNPPKIQHRDPMSWATMKERYKDAFGPALEGLRRNAAPSWKIRTLLNEFGEGVLEGRPHRVALLHPEAAVTVSGEGAVLVSAKIIERHGRPLVLLRAAKPPDGHEVSFDLRIAYGNGEEETLTFFIVAKGTPSNVRGEGSLEGGRG